MRFISTVQPIDGSADRYWCDEVEELDAAKREDLAGILGQIIQDHRGSRFLRGSESSRGFRCFRSRDRLFVDIPVAVRDSKGRTVVVSIGGPTPDVIESWVEEYRRVCREMKWDVDARGITELKGVLDRRPKMFAAAAILLLAAVLAAIGVYWLH
jgi:hypothetical protein